jgi:ATP-dependent RNA helicase RhlE
MVQIGRRANPAETVTQLVYEVPQHLKMNLLIHLLRDRSLNMVLLFSRTKHGADKITRKLEQQGIRTATLHANRSQNQRLRALQNFKSGSARILVATDIAARGIDVEGISHVVNYDFPRHAEDYVHRIGRTGRAHAVGDAISFATPEDHSALRSLERFIGRGLVRKLADGFDYRAQVPRTQTSDPRQRPATDRTAAPSAPARPAGANGRHDPSRRRPTSNAFWRGRGQRVRHEPNMRTAQPGRR